jgi:hypothetical protein
MISLSNINQLIFIIVKYFVSVVGNENLNRLLFR